MNKQQGIRAKLKSRQQGAVAIIVALSLVALIGMLGLVLDLGHLYINKTGLQNAADAAALSGAERLDGTLCRVNSSLSGCDPTQKGAVQYAIETAGRNNYGFNNIPVDIDIEDIYLGNCPSRSRFGATDSDGCSMVAADTVDTAAEAAGLTFLQVDTRDRTLDTWFARIWSILQTQTYAMAVAGRYVTEISPIAVCALDANNEVNYVSENGLYPKFLVEYGFSRGTAYELGSINKAKGVPSGMSAGDQIFILPTAKTASDCSGPQPDMAPYLCGGKSVLDGAIGSTVFANTGVNFGPSSKALNTRFGVVSSGCQTIADSNQTLFTPNYAKTSWMNYTTDDRAPTQSIIADLAIWLAGPSSLSGSTYLGIKAESEKQDGETGGCSSDCGDNHGVLWSNYRPMKKISDTATPEPAVPGDWSSLYGGTVSYTGTLPWSPKYTSANQRRVINTLIVNCSAISGSGYCAEIPVLGVGKFFLQRDVINPLEIYGEFGGLISLPLPSTAQIRLYR